MKKTTTYSTEIRERAVRMVLEYLNCPLLMDCH